MLVLPLLCLPACGDEPPARYTTEHLVVEPSDGERVCQGSLTDMEAQVVRVASFLDLAITSPIHVYYGPLAVDDHCNSDAAVELGGCAGGLDDATYIATDITSSYHELVHAVRRVNGLRAPPFFEEGIAEVLSGFRPFPYLVGVSVNMIEQGPEALSKLAREDFHGSDYTIAGHFMSWLILTHGEEPVAAFLNDARLKDAAEEAFLEHFGLSLQDADVAWRATSEESYQWGEICDPQRDVKWDGERLEFEGRLDCDEEGVLGPAGDRIWTRSQCFMLETEGRFRIELLAPTGTVLLHHQGCSPTGPLTPEDFQDKRVDAGEPQELGFAPCKWEINLSTELSQPIDFVLHLTRL